MKAMKQLTSYFVDTYEGKTILGYGTSYNMKAAISINTVFILIIAHALIIAHPLIWMAKSKMAFFCMIFGNFKAAN